MVRRFWGSDLDILFQNQSPSALKSNKSSSTDEIMGCNSSSISHHEEDLPSTTVTSQASYREREKQRLLAINKERPMAWLFKYPEPYSPPPQSDRMKRTPDSSQASRSYASKSSRSGYSTQNSHTSDNTMSDEPYVDPYLPGPYIQPMQSLHVGKGRSRR